MNDVGEVIDEKIIFENADELAKYNEKLLNGFITYLNKKGRKTHDVFRCSANIFIANGEDHVKKYNDYIKNKIT